MNFPLHQVKDIIEKYKTFDMLEICEHIGAHVLYCDLPQNIEGFFQNIFGEFIIYINRDISSYRKKYVVAHELGHIFMHSEVNSLFMKENSLFNIEKCEKEANIFAAFLILDENFCDLEYAQSFFELDIITIREILQKKNEFLCQRNFLEKV